jgi:Protein of unknown function (DUF2877)
MRRCAPWTMARTEAIDAGLGWVGLPDAPRWGRVVGVFRRAAYVEIDASILAVTTGDAPAGPMHLRLHRLPDMEVGGAAVSSGRTLELGPVSVARNGLPRWQPPPIAARAIVDAAPAAPWLLAGATRSSLVHDPTVASVPALLADGELAQAAALLAGRGPGLTPAGDDALAGILLVMALAGHHSGELDRAAAAPTHAIARAFLTWAARGQAVEPVHQLLAALAAGQRAGAERQRAAVLALGGTSGADLLFGLGLGLGALTSRAVLPT